MALCWTGGEVRRQGTAVMLAAVALLALSGGARAQTPGSGFSSLGGSNSKKPIDIESDRLEVDDQKHVAIFTGNVSATQGDYNLRAPRLEVTYDKAAEAAGPRRRDSLEGREAHKAGKHKRQFHCRSAIERADQGRSRDWRQGRGHEQGR